MNRFITISFVLSAVGLTCGVVCAGVAYPDPAGGWTYVYEGSAVNPAVTTALDGTWDHKDAGSGGLDAWDGSSIGMPGGAPGGVSVLSERATTGPTYLTYLRMQDTGDPRDHAMGPGLAKWSDPSNRKLDFTHFLVPDIGESLASSIIDGGVTISFRTRVAPVGTGAQVLDPMHPDSGGENTDKAGGTPWVANGYLGSDSGKGSFSVCQLTPAGVQRISFSLAIGGVDQYNDETAIAQSGLYMNGLSGTAPKGAVDPYDKEGTLNVLAIDDPTLWHEFWITLQPDATGTGTHLVTVSVDGSLVQQKFYVTAGNASDYSAGDGYRSFVAMALRNTAQMGAIDIDFFAYAPGVIPVPEPATIALLGLGGLALLGIRKRR